MEGNYALMIASFTTPPSTNDIEVIARAEFNEMPEDFRQLTSNIVFRVNDFPDIATEQKMGLQSPFDLMGLYNGALIGEKKAASPTGPDVMILYRRALLDYWCETNEDLSQLVRHVLIHEIGHHFGLSDDDMERLEKAAG